VYSWILYEKKEQEIRGYLTDQLEKIDPNLVQLD